MRKFLNLIKNKKGDTLVLSLALMTFIIFFSAVLVDMGYAYTYKVRMQHISDAASLAGVTAGGKGFISGIDGRKHVYVEQTDADNAARTVISANQSALPSGITVTGYQLNPEGESGLSSHDQYFSGMYTVKVQGESETFFSKYFSHTPFFSFNQKATSQIK